MEEQAINFIQLFIMDWHVSFLLEVHLECKFVDVNHPLETWHGRFDEDVRFSYQLSNFFDGSSFPFAQLCPLDYKNSMQFS